MPDVCSALFMKSGFVTFAPMLLVLGCGRVSGFVTAEIHEIVPAGEFNDESTQVQILGEGFYGRLKGNPDEPNRAPSVASEAVIFACSIQSEPSRRNT